MKTCTKCKIEKELSKFNKCKLWKDGLQYICKSCNNEQVKEYRQANKEKIKEYKQEYRLGNKEKIKEYQKEYHKEFGKEYRLANKEKIKKYRQDNKEKIKQYNKEYQKKYQKEYQKEKRKTDPLFKMCGNLRNRTSQAFKNKGYSKATKTQEMLGIEWEVAKQHIKKQFTKGMNWNNYGEWHIDHIIPLSSANKEDELIKLCHYTNLQPLWAEDNLSKNNTIIETQMHLTL